MKKIILMFTAMLFSVSNFAQKNNSSAEVLYFKADLPCCQGKACNLLEADVKAVVQKLYPGGNVEFRVVRLADLTNKTLVDKYNAKSQTVIIVVKGKKGDKTTDISPIVKNYQVDKDKAAFETAVKIEFDKLLK